MIDEAKEWSEFGYVLRARTLGMSHGPGYEIEINGFPAGIEVPLSYLEQRLEERKIGGKRKEPDKFSILSGLKDEKTTGEQIRIYIPNTDVKPDDYDTDVFRPGHADETRYERYYKAKGEKPASGGGKVSARETVCRAMVAAFAEKFLDTKGVKVIANARRIGGIQVKFDLKKALEKDYQSVRRAVYESDMRCIDTEATEKMRQRLKDLEALNDSCGGVVEVRILGLPAGIGKPVFDKLPADLYKALRSIPAVRGIEDGPGFAVADMVGSESNLIQDGTYGGISSGFPINLNVYFKPTPSIAKEQKAKDIKGNKRKIKIKGRHDTCVVRKAVSVVESMTKWTVADHYLLWEREKA